MIWWRKKKTDLSVAGEVFCDVREGSPGVFQPGSLFLERYHICKTACGGFGEVLFAIDTEDRNRACAVKVVFLDRGASSSDRDFILTEVQLLAQMARTSQLLCALWDVDTGEFDDVPFVYLVMPFYEHGNLRSVMSRDDRPVRHILELAWALTYLNRRLHPFVHLDIKPENIFLSQNLFFGRDVYWVLPTERVVLGDFGLAKFGGEYFKNPVARGHSETYASPEQLRGEPVDFRSDMFSFGVVAYEYLTGSHPFGVGTFDETRRLVMSPGFVPPRLSKSRPDLPSSLVEAVSTCLNKDPVERWPDFGELMRQLCLDFACVCEPRPGTPTEYHESEGKAPLVFEEKALADFRRQGLDCCAAGPGWSPVPSTILFAEYGFKEHQDRFRQDSMGMKKLRVAAVSLYDSCPMYAEAKLVNELEILLKGDATQLVLDRLLEFYGNPEEDGTRASRIVQSRQFGELAKSSCFAALDAAALAVLRLYEAARERRSPPTQQVFMHQFIRYVGFAYPFLRLVDDFKDAFSLFGVSVQSPLNSDKLDSGVLELLVCNALLFTTKMALLMACGLTMGLRLAWSDEPGQEGNSCSVVTETLGLAHDIMSALRAGDVHSRKVQLALQEAEEASRQCSEALRMLAK